jgi:hypothetical protein
MAQADGPKDLRLVHFLLVYNGPRRVLERCTRFDDVDAALVAYAQAEDEFRNAPGIEVVLLGSDSLATLKRTHGHYFEAASEPDLPVLSR